MGCNVLVSLVAVTLLLIAALAMNATKETIVDTAWSTGIADFGSASDGSASYEPDDIEIYLGLSNMVYCVNEDCTVQPYTSCKEAPFCEDASTCRSKFCDECRAANDASDDLVLFSLMLAIPQLLFELQRIAPKTDLNCSKVFGMLASLITAVCCLLAIAEYEESCAANLPEDITFAGFTYKLTWSMGPGLSCLLAATFMKVFSLFVHIIIPTPREMHTVTYRMDQVNWKDGEGQYHAFTKGDAMLLEALDQSHI